MSEATPTATTPDAVAPVTVSEAGTGFDTFKDRSIVAMRVNGELQDLFREVKPGDVIEPVYLSSPDGLNILRHSTAHVVAQAVQRLKPQIRLGIGPPIEDGFYYDFDAPEPFTPEDLKAIEKEAKRIVRENQRFTRRVVTDEQAREELADEPYKLELIGLKGGNSEEHGANENVEVGGSELTIYANVDPKTGECVWQDLCRGPHLPSTRLIGDGFAITRSSGAYWRGSEKNPMLQRIYGTAWPSKEELRAYQTRLEEALKRDHRKLGRELDLFSFPDEIGSGLPVFHPNGAIIRMEMEEHSRKRHIRAGYSFVNTPHITKGHLYEVSRHLEWYADGMYPPMRVDEERNADGEVTKPGQDYYLKPMNCPMHNLIYQSRARSYRDLPLRMFEFGTVYRYEKSGVVHGLTRARGFTQDDAHIYCAREEMHTELTNALQFVLSLLADYGLNDFYLELSTRDPEKFVGDIETWDEATEVLRDVATQSGLELVPDPAGAAFYGPKISVQARDAIGRTWQMSTIQLDFFEPELFKLEYAASDGTRKRPVMIHRALFGSIERFFGVLVEHYAGAFPVWLSPTQVVGIPVANEYGDYLREVLDELQDAGVRVQLDVSDDRMTKKVRTHTLSKTPLMLIAGEEDRNNNAVSFRFRDGTQRNGVPRDEAVALITEAIRDHRQVNSAEDLA